MEKSSPMEWETERFGKGVTFDPATKSASFSGTGFAVARLNPWLPLHRGSVLLEVTELAGDLWVGVVGRNFNPEGEWWSMPFFPPQDASTEEHKRYSKTQHISAVRASSGTVHVKGVEEVNAKLAPFGGPGQPKVLNLEIDVPAYELKMRLLQRDAKGDDTTTAEADLDNKMPELTVAVCFGEPTTPGARTSVRILGSSCERVETHQLKHRRNSREEDRIWSIDDKPSGGMQHLAY